MFSIRGEVLILFLAVTVKLSVSDESNYHGEISEDALPNADVKLDRDIVVTNRDALVGENICGYTLYKSHNEELPFKIVLIDEKTGLAKLKLDGDVDLDYSKIHTYNFDIAAHDCITGNHAPRERIHVEVLPSGTPKPDTTWEEDSYTLEVEENKIYDDILQLEIEGLEGDALKQCKFHITTPEVPFTIDNEERMGILRNTEKLSFARQHNYILEVMAFNCGEDERTAKPLLIDIQVKEACMQGWQGVSDVLNYQSKQLISPIAEQATLRICDDTCDVEKVRVSITLNTADGKQSCDRDSYSVQSQRKICGASNEIVDLLPEGSFGEMTDSVPSVDGREGDDIFSFDGKNVAIEVPSEKFEHTLQHEFTIMTWMKHTPEDDELSSHKKEHILCNADGEEKNRHHYSLFIHNCKLVLLLRREYTEGIDLKEFKPAEWRWTLDEVCDGTWHHYALSMNFPNVLLYVDGSPISDLAHHNPDVIDDWALHPVSTIHSTKLTVGACWLGGEQRMSQYFKGYLAGLSILNGATESDHAIKCMTNCAEKLDFHAMSEMQTGMTVSFNSEMSEITIEGTKLAPVENLFRKVGYENSRVFPSKAERSVTIKTDVNCTDKRQLSLPDVSTAVVIAAANEQTPIITVTGSTKISRPVRDFAPGVNIFADVNILAGTKEELTELVTDVYDKMEKLKEKESFDNKVQSTEEKIPDVKNTLTPDFKLDSCIVKVTPSMNFDDYNKEHIKYTENLIDQLMLEVYQKPDGIIITGTEKVENYERILKQLKYYNARADDLAQISFTLTCTELNGKFTSNQFTVEVTIEHEDHSNKQQDVVQDTKQNVAQDDQPYVPPAVHAKDSSLNERMKSYPQGSQNDLEKSFVAGVRQGGAHATAGSGVGMVIIVVVCVGFLMFMIVLGVIRIRSTHQRNRSGALADGEKAEMEWDDSALTITVNPMDKMGDYEEGSLAGGVADDSDTDDDDSSYHDDHDDVDSSEEEPDIRELKSRGLEWDESDMSKFQCKV